MPAWSDLEGHVAYFSMEYGLDTAMNTYNGGLGILAGDVFKAFADADAPAVGVTPLNDAGLGEQHIDDDGNQYYESAEWDYEAHLTELDVTATMRLGDDDVTIGAWQYDVDSASGGSVPVLFLDTNRPENADWVRELTRHVYAEGLDRRSKVAQEMVLGIGGVRVLDELGYDVGTYHMNEGHASFLTLELLRRADLDADAVREQCVFTTHTPVAAAHEEFDYGLVGDLLADLVPMERVREHSHPDVLHTTLLALDLSRYVNSVAKCHQWVTHRMFPDYRDDVDAITNGVHVPTWVGEHVLDTLDDYIDGYREDPALLRHATFVADEDLWDAHQAEKEDLLDYVETKTGETLDPEVCTLGFARRAVQYKRATLPFHDVDRLRDIVDEVGDLQIVYAGKGFPGDPAGEELVREVHRYADELAGDVDVVYLPDYDMEMGAKMTAGVDVWLNVPRRPREACGTSGMKAALNGVPQLGTLDGWWVEGHIEGETGWKVGPEPFSEELSAEEEDAIDAGALYDRLEHDVLPLYYDDREGWTDVMRNCIAMNGAHYSAKRMIEEYLVQAYA